MSTRANVIIKDNFSKLFFYRHSDGYPEGTLPTLNKFLDWVKTGKIRDNVGQAAGWLIIIGNEEYGAKLQPDSYDRFYNWKVGAYEPTDNIHGDIEFLYIIDLKTKTIKTITTNFERYAV